MKDKVHFFQTEAAQVAIKQAKLSRRFYQSIVKLICMNGREEDPLTIFDLEDMIESLPRVSSAIAVKVSELASNAGREYVSAHEMRRREQELTAKIFKAAYLGYLIASEQVKSSDLFPTKSQPSSGESFPQ